MPEGDSVAPGPFNGPVECAIRALVLLDAMAPVGCDLRRMVVYDYLMVHSGDITPDNYTSQHLITFIPESLHPATPHRSGEMLVRRETLVAGLHLLRTKGLAIPVFGDDGITYAVTELGRLFLKILGSEYIRDLRDRGGWVARAFGSMGDEALSQFANSHLRDWGGEFVNESLLRGRPE